VAPSDIQRMAWSHEGHLPAYKNFPALDLDQKTAREVSPLEFVTKDDAPTLLIAGDKDTLVPITHSQEIHEALEQAEVPTKLVTIDGAGHGFVGDQLIRDGQEMCDWFETHLLEKPSEAKPAATP